MLYHFIDTHPFPLESCWTTYCQFLKRCCCCCQRRVATFKRLPRERERPHGIALFGMLNPCQDTGLPFYSPFLVLLLFLVCFRDSSQLILRSQGRCATFLNACRTPVWDNTLDVRMIQDSAIPDICHFFKTGKIIGE